MSGAEHRSWSKRMLDAHASANVTYLPYLPDGELAHAVARRVRPDRRDQGERASS